MVVWDKIHHTNELKYLFIKKIDIENCDKLDLIWTKIYDEYLLEFGLSEKYQEVLKLRKEIAIKQIKFLETSDNIWITLIKLDQESLRVISKNESKLVNFKKNITNIEKIQGVRINPLKITVLEYFNYLKHLSNG